MDTNATVDAMGSGRRQAGGGYMYQINAHGGKFTTQTRIMSMVRILVMSLLGDADSKVKKIGFIKTWAQKGLSGKAAQTARLVVSAQRLYNKMARMYIFCYDNMVELTFARAVDNFISLKKMGMELDHLVQAILEYENQDPSGRIYGRRSGQHLQDVDDDDEN